MRAIHVTRYGQANVLAEGPLGAVEPGPGHVRIRVKASGVTYADVLAREGQYAGAPDPPFIPGFEVSGYIDAIGPGPTRHELGRHVLALSRFGGYADSVIVPGDLAFNAPAVLSHNEAAAVPVSYLTAMVSLYRMANVKAGEIVLLHNAGGGVGVAALQLAHLRRAVVIGTASRGKHNALRSLGMDHVLDSQADDLAAAVLDLTQGRGADVVLDPRDADSIARSAALLAPLGRLVASGLSGIGAAGKRLDGMGRALAASLRPNLGVFGLDLNLLWGERRFLHASMEALLTDLSASRLKPVVAKALPLARAADAHRLLEERSNVGKVVLTC